MTRSEAKRIREILEEAVQSLDDATAEEVIMFFPEATDDIEIVKGKRYRHNGKLKKAKKEKKKKDKFKPDEIFEGEERGK